MKNQKHIFNGMLLSYNRYVKKLKRLIAKGINIYNQEILEKEISKLSSKIKSLFIQVKKVVPIAALSSGFMLLQPNSLKSQNFAEELLNPFGLTQYDSPLYDQNLDVPKFIDIDGDSDIDLLFSQYSNDYYYQNIGTASNPIFDAPILNPNWISAAAQSKQFVDLDADGDFDMIGQNNKYYTNIGSATSPAFGAGQPNLFPFFDYAIPNFQDMDGDGDLDATQCVGKNFYYFENLGTNTNANFGDAILNPFSFNSSLLNPDYDRSEHSMADVDSDGDLDLMCMFHNGVNFRNNFEYFENIGNENFPLFENPIINPFNLPQENYVGYYGEGGFSSGTFAIPIDFKDIDNDGDKDLLAAQFGTIYYFENGDDFCNRPNDLAVEVKENGYKLTWNALEGSTQCELNAEKAAVPLFSPRYIFNKIINKDNPTSFLVKTNIPFENTAYIWRVRCNCGISEELSGYSIYNVFTTGAHNDFGQRIDNSNNENAYNIFSEESNVATSNNKVKLFPNPAKGSFSINTDLENYNIELTDITGKLVYSQNNINQASFNLDIKQIEAGTYFVKINNANASEVIKLMVD